MTCMDTDSQVVYSTSRPQTIRCVLVSATQRLKAGGIDSARLDADVLRVEKSQLYVSLDEPLELSARHRFGDLLIRRLHHEPIATSPVVRSSGPLISWSRPMSSSRGRKPNGSLRSHWNAPALSMATCSCEFSISALAAAPLQSRWQRSCRGRKYWPQMYHRRHSRLRGTMPPVIKSPIGFNSVPAICSIQSESTSSISSLLILRMLGAVSFPLWRRRLASGSREPHLMAVLMDSITIAASSAKDCVICCRAVR